MTAYTALTEQYEKENGIKKEDKMENKDETTKKYEESASLTETYHDRLQRYYKKDFRPGDRVFVKPQNDCKTTDNFAPMFGRFGEIITIAGYSSCNDEVYFYEEDEYPSGWLLPVVPPEDAYRAILDGKHVTAIYRYGKDTGLYYNSKTKCFATPEDELDAAPLEETDFLILDEHETLTVTKQEIADKFGVDVENLIIED